MATINEMMLENMDAAKTVETAAKMSAGDTFEGNLDTKNDEDWIRIELTAGMLYTISLSGAEDGLADTILKLFDSKGDLIDSNDDYYIDGLTDLNSKLEFTPEVSGVYYISASAYTGNPFVDNKGAYTLTVMEMEPPDADTRDDIPGTEENDKLFGTEKGEKIIGLGGNDSLYAMGGDDTLDGGDGDDLLVGGPGADTLMGGAGDNDTISYAHSEAGVIINLTDGTATGGNATGDTLVDMDGDAIEHVIGSEHDDALTGSRVPNSLWGMGGNDELDGLRGNDKLFGGAGDDNLDGGRGDDTLEGGYGADVLTGGDGMDTASYAGSMMGVTVRLHTSSARGGDAKGDTFGATVTATYMNMDDEEVEVMLPDIMHLTGSANADILAGDFRNNTIKGGDGDDKIFGGPNPGNVSMTDVPSNADTLMGEGGNDRIWGGAGDDTLDGGAGNDMLRGGPGNDDMKGGAGSDLIYADAMDTVIDGYGVDDDDSIEDAMDVDTLSYAMVDNEDEEGITTALAGMITNIENIVGSQYDDVLTGDDRSNVIEGGAGRDTLVGGDGDGVDTLSYENSDDWVRVTLNDNAAAANTSRGHARGDTATGFENVTGSAYDDELTGNDGSNVLKGLAGDDEITGGDGADTVEGGAGADEMDGDNGNETDQVRSMADVLSYAGSDAGVTVHLATASASGGHADGDTIATFEVTITAEDEDEDDTEIDVSTFEYVTGSMHDDSLTGDHRDNHLVGGGGDDALRGGAGADLLIGGPGADMLDGGEDEDEDENNMVPDPSENAAEDAMVAAFIDWAVYKHAKEGVTIDLSTNMGTGGEAMGDTLRNIELVWGSEFADTFIASNRADIIEGDGGSDTVSYEASELGVTVNLSSAAQHTTVPTTGSGDTLVFPADDDPATVTNPASGLTGVPRRDAMGAVFDENNIEDEDDNPNANGAAGDKLRSIENLTGSDNNDSLTGDANANILKGGAGDDMLIGSSARADGADANQANPLVAIDDMMYGGDGDDTLIGNAGDDLLEGGAGDDNLYGGKGPDDTGGGLKGRDILRGGAGDDLLDGGSWGDALSGGAGDDILIGGGGSDWIYFGPGHGFDVITDFDNSGNDRIVLRDFEEITSIDDLDGMIRQRGDSVEIDLTAYGGGKISLRDITLDLDGTTAANLTESDFVFFGS